MKVKEIIDQLNKYYSPNDELIIEYWDKSTVENYGLDREMTPQEWSSVVMEMSRKDWIALNDAYSDIMEVAYEIMNTEKIGEQ